MSSLLLLSLFLFFLSFVLIFYAILSNYLRPKAILEEQLEFYRVAWEKFYGRSLARREIGIGPRLISGALGLTRDVSRKAGVSRALEQHLERSGMTIDVVSFIFYHFVGVVVAGILSYLVLGIWGTLILVIFTAFAPFIYLHFKENRRQSQLGEQLPPLLTMVAGLLKAGHGFYQAIDSAVREMSPPISYEFKKVLTEARLGISFEQAIDDMARRVQNEDFNWLVVAIKIQRETGGNLSEILELLAKTVRDREQLARQIKTLTAEGRISAYILLALPIIITLILFLINPDYIGVLFNTAAGIIMLIIALTLMIVGTLWLRSIVKIKV